MKGKIIFGFLMFIIIGVGFLFVNSSTVYCANNSEKCVCEEYYQDNFEVDDFETYIDLTQLGDWECKVISLEPAKWDCKECKEYTRRK